MTKPNCPYCGLVLKHHARAAEHAALVNKVLDDRIRGQYPGLAPGQVPQIGYQYGAPLSPSFQQFQSQQVNQAVRRAGVITLIAIVVPAVLAIGIGVVVTLYLVL